MCWQGSASGKLGPSPKVQQGGDPVLLDDQGLVQHGPAPGNGHGAKPAQAFRNGHY